MRPPSRSTLFPYTTLFRSVAAGMSIAIPLRVTYRASGKESLKAIAAGLFADDKKAELLRDYNFLKVDQLEKDRKSTRLNSSHGYISYAVFCLKKKTKRHST